MNGYTKGYAFTVNENTETLCCPACEALVLVSDDVGAYNGHEEKTVCPRCSIPLLVETEILYRVTVRPP